MVFVVIAVGYLQQENDGQSDDGRERLFMHDKKRNSKIAIHVALTLNAVINFVEIPIKHRKQRKKKCDTKKNKKIVNEEAKRKMNFQAKYEIIFKSE